MTSKKEIVDGMVSDLEKEVMKLEIFEKYYLQKIISGKKIFEQALGQVQSNLKSNRELLNWLKDDKNDNGGAKKV